MKQETSLETQRRAFEQATWTRANKHRFGGKRPVLYDAGNLGFCLLEWAGACGGRWKNRWFDKAETLSLNDLDQRSDRQSKT
jgi:hypothetical protein